CVQGVDYPLTF
nr:immunoglobulin light chain junction region [Macaca mulatta]MOV34512.1 immunoglobulin light chain junction region [Macaca mulatta]